MMPKFKDRDLKQETTPGITISGGEITASDYNSLDWSTQIKDFSNMRDGDGIISPSLKALKLPINQSEFRIQPGNDADIAKEASDYIEWALNNLIGGYNNFEHHALLALDFGLMLFEKVFKRGVTYHNGERNKTTNVIARFSPIENETIEEFYYSDNVNWRGIKHRKRVPEQSDSLIDIEADKLFRFTWNEEFNDVRGRSILRPVREPWSLRKKIIRNTARASTNGAGIPVATSYGKLNPNEEAKVTKILRTVGNVENGYFLEQKEKLEFRIESLTNQENNVPMIELLNREIFFNSLTQFMTSGLGQNGSRAATAELKTTFELAATGIQKWLEDRMQMVIDEMIDISYLGNMPKESRPIFVYDTISQVDLLDATQQFKNVFETNIINKTPEDEKHMRNVMGLPEALEAPEVAVEESEEETPTEIQESNLEATFRKDLLEEPKVRAKNLERAKEIFEFESANEHFLTTQEKVEKVTNEMMNKIFSDIENQLKDNHKKDIDVRFSREFISKLTSVYDEGKTRGTRDMEKELKKVGLEDIKLEMEVRSIDLARKPRTVIKGIERAVRKLTNTIKSGIESTMARMSNVFLEKAGGLGSVLLKLQLEAFKSPRRGLITETERGYNDGRADVMRANKEEVDTWIYSATLDQNLCEVCGPIDGSIYTDDDITGEGFNRTQPINPGCLGNLSGEPRCRCQWVPNTRSGREQVLGG